MLVSNSASHSIERFNTNGVWIDTFATTGPRTPYGLAASPKRSGQRRYLRRHLYRTIFRYHSNRQPTANWGTFNVPPDGSPVEDVLFDPYFGQTVRCFDPNNHGF
jgi:hypothetical protein